MCLFFCIDSFQTMHGIFEFDIARTMFFPKNQVRFGNTIYNIDDTFMKNYKVIAAMSIYDDQPSYPQSIMFYKNSVIYLVLHHPRIDTVQMFTDVRNWHDSKREHETRKLSVFLFDKELQQAWKDCI